MEANYYANNTQESIDLKKSLEKEGWEINHIFSGSAKPIFDGGGWFLSGAGNIRFTLLTKQQYGMDS